MQSAATGSVLFAPHRPVVLIVPRVAEYPWSPAPGGGTQCDKHGGDSFRPEHGAYCPHCLSQPVGTEVPEPGEGEQECDRATQLGLPDSLAVEVAMWRDRKQSLRDARECRAIARKTEALAAEFLEKGDHENAREWLRIAVAYRGQAHKASDTSGKHTKPVVANVQLRERRAAKEKRDRLLAQLKGKGGN